MGKQTRIETYFRNRLKNERERREWSQTDMANRLSDKGIHLHMTTIAKIESGHRAVRIDEATAIADLFEMSLDALLGRGAGLEDDLAYSLRTLKEASRRIRAQLLTMMTDLADARDEVVRYEFDASAHVNNLGGAAVVRLLEASKALELLEGFSATDIAVPGGTTVAERENQSRPSGSEVVANLYQSRWDYSPIADIGAIESARVEVDRQRKEKEAAE